LAAKPIVIEIKPEETQKRDGKIAEKKNIFTT